MTNTETMLKNRPKKWIINLIFTIVLLYLLVSTFRSSAVNLQRLSTFHLAVRDMLNGFLNINFDFFLGRGLYDFNEGIVYMAIQTLAIAFIGTFLGAILAIPFGFLSSETIVGKAVSKIGTSILVLIRVFPEIVLALIILKGFGLNPLTCVITIGIHSIGMLGKLFGEAIDNMDKSPLEALDAVGANVWQKIRFGILPQIIPDLSSITLYRLDINVRSASVLGLVGTGAGGYGAVLLLASMMGQWDILATVMVAIIVLVLCVDMLSSYLRKKLL